MYRKLENQYRKYSTQLRFAILLRKLLTYKMIYIFSILQYFLEEKNHPSGDNRCYLKKK